MYKTRMNEADYASRKLKQKLIPELMAREPNTDSSSHGAWRIDVHNMFFYALEYKILRRTPCVDAIVGASLNKRKNFSQICEKVKLKTESIMRQLADEIQVEIEVRRRRYMDDILNVVRKEPLGLFSTSQAHSSWFIDVYNMFVRALDENILKRSPDVDEIYYSVRKLQNIREIRDDIKSEMILIMKTLADDIERKIETNKIKEKHIDSVRRLMKWEPRPTSHIISGPYADKWFIEVYNSFNRAIELDVIFNTPEVNAIVSRIKDMQDIKEVSPCLRRRIKSIMKRL
jgi:hypothetical protein